MSLPAKVANFGADVTTPYARMIASFQSPVLVILYAVIRRLRLHPRLPRLLSMFQSHRLGAVPQTRKPLVLLSGVVGLVIFVMFMAPPGRHRHRLDPLRKGTQS